MIIDASVALKWVLKGEDGQEKSRLLLNKHRDGKQKIVVPDLFFYEVANTLATKTELSVVEVSESLTIIFEAGLVVYRPTEKDILQAAKLAKKYKTSVYDMLYAVIARKHKTRLITADENFVKKTGFKFVKLLKDIKPDNNNDRQNIN